MFRLSHFFRPALLLSFISVTASFTGCTDDSPASPAPNQNVTDSLYSFNGETWLLYLYRVGESTVNYNADDTLVFSGINTYRFNNDTGSYSLFSIPGGFKLTLNGTRWGDISGTVYDYNLTQGDIQGLRFTEYFTGSNAVYYLWMRRL